jgi:hypothetical protein
MGSWFTEGLLRRGELRLLDRLFLDVKARGFPLRRTAAYDAAPSERYNCAWSATARANSPAARARQHVTASVVVPAH